MSSSRTTDGTADGWVRNWLRETHSTNATPSYFHSRFVEDDGQWERVSGQAIAYFRDAHADAIRRLQRLASVSLHPVGSSLTLPPPYQDYPFGLPEITLQGCFGEVLAGLLAESVGAAGRDDWEVPAHLFHTHLVAYQQLEQQAQTGSRIGTLVGRTGDDCLAFRRGDDGEIRSVLFCESKCTREHNASLIAEAHSKVSSSGIVDILQLIEALENRDDPSAAEWSHSLRVFHAQFYATPPPPIDRYDAVYYVHGQAPIQESTWISPDRPHANYVARRPLHSVEICLANVRARLNSIYQEEVWR
jgi:hypothetical protein